MSGNFSKIVAYVGFAIKSKNIIYGTDDIIKSKRAKNILLSESLSDSSKSKIENYAKQKNIEVKNFKAEVFNEIMNNQNIKAAAITNESLADAINKSLANN